MSNKTIRIISIVLMVIPSLLIAFSGIMKLSGAAQMVDGLSKAGFGPYIKVLGAIELVSLALFLFPKTYKIGFLLLCAYLGGALATELSHGQPPMSALLLVFIWISVFLRNKSLFLGGGSFEVSKG